MGGGVWTAQQAGCIEMCCFASSSSGIPASSWPLHPVEMSSPHRDVFTLPGITIHASVADALLSHHMTPSCSLRGACGSDAWCRER